MCKSHVRKRPLQNGHCKTAKVKSLKGHKTTTNNHVNYFYILSIFIRWNFNCWGGNGGQGSKYLLSYTTYPYNTPYFFYLVCALYCNLNFPKEENYNIIILKVNFNLRDISRKQPSKC